MKRRDGLFYFPHYWFDVIFLLTYVPTRIIFDYFALDWWGYTGRWAPRTSVTAFLILIALYCLQFYLFRYQLKKYLLPEHEDLYAWLARKKDSPLGVLPLALCRKTLKWEEPEDPGLRSVYRSVLQFGNATRIMVLIWMLVDPVMGLLGYSREMGRVWSMRRW